MVQVFQGGVSTKIIGFVKVFNEGDIDKGGTGNLRRCLENLTKICGKGNIVICNDSSTDNSLEIAEKYTKHIITLPHDFKAELEHKQKLLEVALACNPDWIYWQDADEILEKKGFEGIRILCKLGDTFHIDCFSFHEINLWRSQCWYRLDNLFNSGYYIRLWKAKPDLKFDTSPGLHKPQHPQGLNTFWAHAQQYAKLSLQVIHFGFSTIPLIVRKYKTYKSLGQTGWALNRLIDERTLQLAPVNMGWFSEEDKPKMEPKPNAMSEEEWKKLVS